MEVPGQPATNPIRKIITRTLLAIVGIGAVITPFFLGGKNNKQVEAGNMPRPTTIPEVVSTEFRIQDGPHLEGIKDVKNLTIEQAIKGYFGNGNRVLGVGDPTHDRMEVPKYMADKLLPAFAKSEGKKKILFLELPPSYQGDMDQFMLTGDANPLRELMGTNMRAMYSMAEGVSEETKKKLLDETVRMFETARGFGMKLVCIDTDQFSPAADAITGFIKTKNEMESRGEDKSNPAKYAEVQRNIAAAGEVRVRESNPVWARNIVAQMDKESIGLIFGGSGHFSGSNGVGALLGVSYITLYSGEQNLVTALVPSNNPNEWFRVALADEVFRESVAMTRNDLQKLGANPSAENLFYLIANAKGFIEKFEEQQVKAGNKRITEVNTAFAHPLGKMMESIRSASQTNPFPVDVMAKELGILNEDLNRVFTDKQRAEIGYLQLASAALGEAVKVSTKLAGMIKAPSSNVAPGASSQTNEPKKEQQR